MALVSFSQERIVYQDRGIKEVRISTPLNSVKKSLSKATTSEWYNPTEYLSLPDFAVNVDFLAFDSIAKTINTSGVNTAFSLNDQAVCQIIDGKDGGIDLAPNPDLIPLKMSRFTNFVVDSIDFLFMYHRRVNLTNDGLGNMVPVVDTLFIYYFNGTQIDTNQRFAGITQAARFGMVGYDFKTRKPANYFKMDTIFLKDFELATPLNNGNTFSASTIGFKAPAGLSFNSNGGRNGRNLVGFALQFRAGIKYDTSYVSIDLRDSSSIPVGTKWVNAFGYRSSQNGGQAQYLSKFFSGSLFVDQSFSYGQKNGWNGWVPGVGYSRSTGPAEKFMISGMKLSSNNISVKEVANSFSLGQAYPNPSSNVVNIAFDLKSNNNVKVSILNLLGQEVINVADDKFTAGKSEVSVDVTNLSAGVYFYSMTVDGVSQAQKLIIK